MTKAPFLFPLTARLASVVFLFVVTACSDSPSDVSDAGTNTNGSERVEAVFMVPQSSDSGEFFDVPWPTDLRLHEDRTLDLRAFPAETAVMKDYVKLLDGRIPGFSTNGAVYFRFTGPIDPASLLDRPEQATESGAAYFLMDADPQSPDRGKKFPLLSAFYEHLIYAGDDMLALLPYPGFVLRPKTTYVAVVTNALKGADGRPVKAQSDLEAVLGADEPAAPRLARAWRLHQPVRSLCADGLLSCGEIVSVALFTTQDPVSEMGALRAAVYEDLPSPPEPVGLSHVSSQSTYEVYEGTYETPIYQQGEPPYKTDGEIEMDEDGKPILARTEQIRFAITVPHGTMPDAGWPVVLYSHGTGGDYMTFIRAGVAGLLAHTSDGAAFAMVGIDQVLHGPRCGQEVCHPESDVFNFNNPFAGRDNIRQSAVDNFQLVRFVEHLDVLSAPSSGDPIRFDADHFYFMGHSQGGLTGPPFLAFEPAVKAAVLSGAGGSMILALNLKTEPVDVVGLAGLMLGIDEMDYFQVPLTVIQALIDPSDPLNYARLITQDPPQGSQVKSIFQSQGLIDHDTAPAQIEALGVAMGLTWAEPFQRQLDGFGLIGQGQPSHRPISGNLDSGNQTGVFVQYISAPDSDGHFVIFDLDSAKADYTGFFSSALEGIPVLE